MCRVGDVELAHILGILDGPCLVIELTMDVEAEDLHLGVLRSSCLVICDLDVDWHLKSLLRN